VQQGEENELTNLIFGTNTAPPSAHPLDSDWRFTDQSVEKVIDLLPKHGRILTVGTPSVARRLEELDYDVLLIDRQPLQGVRNHLALQVGERIAGRGFGKFAVIDPPWYLTDMKTWLRWTANLLGARSEIIVPSWPTFTRPHAVSEWQELVDDVRDWATIRPVGISVNYQVPNFERNAEMFGVSEMSTSPRKGDLYHLYVHSVPDFNFEPVIKTWQRFVLNDYQLAVSLERKEEAISSFYIPGANGRYWPFVSRRAPNRDLISIWSSDNEVGCIEDSKIYCSGIRRAILKPDAESFDHNMQNFRSIQGWNFPRPPYWRICEWQQ
jgi:hypothetical protein